MNKTHLDFCQGSVTLQGSLGGPSVSQPRMLTSVRNDVLRKENMHAAE